MTLAHRRVTISRAAVVLLLSLRWGSNAFAQTAADDVEQLVREGVDLRKAQRDAEALARFEQAYARAPSPRIEAQIGLAERALRRWVDAEKHLRESLDAAAADPWVDKNREPIAFGLATVEKHLGTLDVEVDVDEAELWVNGVRVATLPSRSPVRVGEGPNAVEVRARGFVSVTRNVDVAPLERVRLVLTLAAEPSPSPIQPPPEVAVATPASPSPALDARPAKASPARVAGLITCGGGAAAVVAGVVMGGLALAKKNELSTACASDGLCGSEADRNANTAAHTDATIATIALLGGAAALVTGIVLVVTSSPPAKQAQAIHVVPLAGPSLGGAMFVASF